jgi:hypothetical protein
VQRQEQDGAERVHAVEARRQEPQAEGQPSEPAPVEEHVNLFLKGSKPMAVTVVLLKSSPDKLRYLVSQDGAAGVSVLIPNVAGAVASPDLGFDSDSAGPLGGGIIDQPAANQPAARLMLLGGGQGNATCKITPRVVPAGAPTGSGWGVDANVAGGKPNLTVFAPAGVVTDAVLEIALDYSAGG